MDLEKQKLEIKGALVHFYRNASQEDYLQALENAIEEIQTIKNINYTRCSTQLKLVYTSDFCKWLETGFTYYDKTSDFLNKKGYRMTFKELVSKYEQEQNKKALIV